MTNNLCIECRHYVGDLRCFAFPEGIPKEILLGKQGHDEVLDGQELDFVFEPEEPFINEAE